MGIERELAEAVMAYRKAWIDEYDESNPESRRITWIARNRIDQIARQILSQPEREAGEVVREMRNFRREGSVEREIACRWADALEAAQARVAELEGK